MQDNLQVAQEAAFREARCRNFWPKYWVDLNANGGDTARADYNTPRLSCVLHFLTKIGPDRLIGITESQASAQDCKLTRVFYWADTTAQPTTEEGH